MLRLPAMENAKQYGKGEAADAAALALRTTALPDGERVHRWHLPARSPDDLLAYVTMEETMDGDPHGAMAAGIVSMTYCGERSSTPRRSLDGPVNTKGMRSPSGSRASSQ